MLSILKLRTIKGNAKGDEVCGEGIMLTTVEHKGGTRIGGLVSYLALLSALGQQLLHLL